MRSFVVESQSEAQTRDIAAKLANHLDAGAIVALEGPLGSGKTMFVRGIAEGLGLESAQVSSPTFIICHEYELASEAVGATPRSSEPPTLIHIDAYRIKSRDDLESIGWSELLQSGNAPIAIEWPSRMAGGLDGLNDRLITITFEHTGEHSRSLSINAPERTLAKLRGDLEASETTSRQSAVSTSACRTCGKLVNRKSPEFPFCSARCRLAELNKWFSESYRISRPVEADEELDE